MLRIQSNGIGQQSMALYFMSSMGVLPRLDYSVFADPGREKKESYEYIRWAMEWAKENNGVPIIWTGKKDLYKDLIDGTNSIGNRFASIPAYTFNGEGQLRRQCTDEYKIAEFNKVVRRLYGLKSRQHYPKTEVYMGITIEELKRVSINAIRNFINVYPFCNYQTSAKYGSKFLNFNEALEKLYTRIDCVSWLKDNGFEVPPKSSCTFCPYQSNKSWLDLKLNDPEEWNAVVNLDESIRHSSKKGVREPIYLHRSGKPLKEVNLNEDQQSIDYECEGYCDV